jgi:hypothetical protein
MSRLSILSGAFALLMALPALADFQPVRAESDFRALIDGRELTRFGVRLQVSQQGRITGRGFGFAVGGQWEWLNGYFCRTLEFAGTGDPYNCQLVLRDGDTLRFIKDQGRGDFADLRLR